MDRFVELRSLLKAFTSRCTKLPDLIHLDNCIYEFNL